jgi:hypothetical protein
LLELTKKEEALIKFIRTHPFCSFKLTVQNGQPLRIEEPLESMML